MFVQSAHFINDHTPDKSVNEAITVYGTELKSNNAKLAKMNLAIHGIEGKIIEGNSFYTNPHNLTGKCDFVMANPPFNVSGVDAKNKFLAEDERLPFGAPLTGKGTISNGNYLFMQYFYSYLNETGRAGFVMASSATDAGNAEKKIRQQLIESGDVECIVAIGNNFFYTRSLPCHIWFFNKGKSKANKDKILMIDARNTYRKVTTTVNDFSDDQLEGLTAIKDAFRGDKLSVSKDNEWFAEHFPDGKYQDVEGLCKIANLEEVIEQDYSLTPGRYVGVKIDIDMDFDYKGRMAEIHQELGKLNDDASELMNQIQSVKL
jgi:type I restriction enzyme M protein